MNRSRTRWPASLLKSIPLSLLAPALISGLIWILIVTLFNQGLERMLAWEGVVLAATGLALIVLLHFIVPWDPNVRFVSEYARAKGVGFLMDWSFAFLGLASIVLGRSLQLLEGLTFL